MRILLVEDDAMLGKATAEGLKTAYAVDWCQTAEDAQAALKATPYDLVILDIGLPKRKIANVLGVAYNTVDRFIKRNKMAPRKEKRKEK